MAQVRNDTLLDHYSRQNAWSKLWIWIVLLWVLDLTIKYAVSQSFYYGERLSIVPFFDLILIHNTGAAFSFLADQSGWQRWFFAVVGVIAVTWLVIWLRRTTLQQKLLAFGLSGILAGALGNLTERIVNGYVVDYLLVYWHPYYFPAFNLADSLISLGAVAVLLDAFINRKKTEDILDDHA